MAIDIEANLELTDTIRTRAIEHLTSSDEVLHQNLADKDQAALLMKLLDGKDRQALTLQKNSIDSRIADGLSNLDDAADKILEGLSVSFGIRTANTVVNQEANATLACEFEFVPDEASLEPAEEMNFETLTNRG